jgi:hypothetical protein
MSFDKVYSFILNQLSLTDEHKTNLLGRGISEEDIAINGYKSWPYKRIHITAACVAEFGEASLLCVPGFWKDDRGKVTLSGVSGIAIPVRNLAGKIEGIKLRPDKPNDPTSKYVHLSSNPEPNKRTGEVKYPNGTAAKISCHFPQRVGSESLEGKDIRATEGELKADIASNLSDIYTFSIPGVGLWEHAIPHLEKIKPERVIISYDSDKSNQVSTYSNQPYEVAVHLANFYCALKDAGFKVVIEDWDKSLGKGIDDVLADGKQDQVRFLSDAEAEEFVKKATGDSSSSSAEWIYIIGVQRFVNTRTGQELTKDQYKDKMMVKSKKKDPVEVALKSSSFSRIDYPTYFPNQPKVITRPDGATEYNYWRGVDLQAEEGDVQAFLDHCAYILPNPTECGHLLDFLAYQIQFPGEKVHWAILLQGTQGTGKSFFGYIMSLCLGAHNVSLPSNEDIHEPYTGWQKNCQLIIIEELMARGRLELMNKLKPKITQPTCNIREMYKPPYTVPNRFNFFMLTNHEDAIIIDDKDRRYCVLFSPAVPRNESYYKELFTWAEANAGKLLHFFRSRDLSAFPAKGHAPHTEAKVALARMSATPIKSWIMDGIENEAWPFMTDVLTVTHLIGCVPNYIRGATPTALGRALNECGARQLNQVRLETGERVRPWCLRRHEIWAGAEGETVVAEIERWSANKEPGGNPLMDARPL